MSTSEEETISAEEFRVLAHRAGLDLSPEEMDGLRPMLQWLRENIKLLQDPSLPLAEPAAIFSAQWPHQ